MTRLVILCCCAVWALTGCSRPEPLPTYNSVPDFALTSERGETLTLDDLHGQVWVADFIFTSCMGPCPLMSAHMAKLQRALDDDGLAVKLVSVSVDPARVSSRVGRARGSCVRSARSEEGGDAGHLPRRATTPTCATPSRPTGCGGAAAICFVAARS